MNIITKKSLFLALFGIATIALPQDGFARGERSGGHRGSDLQERSYGRDRSYDHDGNYRHYDYNRGYRNGAEFYGDGMYYDGYLPAPAVDSYNDITNPLPGDQNTGTNFQNSTFDNQVFDFNN